MDSAGCYENMTIIIVLRYSIVPTTFGYLFMLYTYIYGYVQPEVVDVNRKLNPFSLVRSQMKP